MDRHIRFDGAGHQPPLAVGGVKTIQAARLVWSALLPLVADPPGCDQQLQAPTMASPALEEALATAAVPVTREPHGGQQPVRSFSIAVAVSLGHPHVAEDFLHGARMLHTLGAHTRAVPVLATCESQLEFVTPLYELGSADKWDVLVARRTAKLEAARTLDLQNRGHQHQHQQHQQPDSSFAASIWRLQAATDFVESFVLLHHLAGEQFRTGGAYIHCDAKEGPSKLLSQYAIMCSRMFLI
jgi:hypothetical protein